MIQRVNNQNYTNKYSHNISKVKNTGEDTPAFLLGNEKEGVVWERQEETTGKKNQKSLSQAKAEERFPSANGNSSNLLKATAMDPANQNNNPNSVIKPGDSAAYYQVKNKLVSFARNLLKRITNFFWYGNDANRKQETEETQMVMQRAKTQTISTEELDKTKPEDENTKSFASTDEQGQKEFPETNLSPQEKDARIRELLAKKDTEAVMEILTEHHTRQLAKKSGLLTQYDRHGRIKMPGGSEQNRILANDNAMKM